MRVSETIDSGSAPLPPTKYLKWNWNTLSIATHVLLNACCCIVASIKKEKEEKEGGRREFTDIVSTRRTIEKKIKDDCRRDGDQHPKIQSCPASTGSAFEPDCCRVGRTERNYNIVVIYGNDDAIVGDVVFYILQFGVDFDDAHSTAATTSPPPVASQLSLAQQFPIDAPTGIVEPFVDNVVNYPTFDCFSSAAATTVGDELHVGFHVDVAPPTWENAHFAQIENPSLFESRWRSSCL